MHIGMQAKFGLFSSKKLNVYATQKIIIFCLSVPSSVSRVKYVLFVTINRGVCIRLLVNTKTIYFILSLSCIIIELQFNQPMVLFVPGMCFIQFLSRSVCKLLAASISTCAAHSHAHAELCVASFESCVFPFCFYFILKYVKYWSLEFTVSLFRT